MSDPNLSSGGIKSFAVIWFGQFVSLLGTSMTNFGISFWIFTKTGEASALTWALFFLFTPSILASPIAGAIVDRANRKHIMILSDLVAGMVTISWLLLLAADSLQIWHIYLGNAFSGLFNSFQFPAYSAAVSLMVPKAHYGRANGLIALAGSASFIMAPAFAGALLGPIGLVGIMAIDMATFGVAIGTLAMSRIPQPAATAASDHRESTLWQESLFGFRYIFERPSLLGLQLVFFASNLLSTIGLSLTIPMVLARTGNSEIALASVQSIGAVGGVVGGALMAAWGGPKRKVHGVLIGMALASLLGQLLMGVGRVLLVWAAASAMTQLLIPIINGSNQAIWQAKVPPDLQGRVFSVRRMIAQVTVPVSTAMAGPLADRIFEPAFSNGGRMVDSMGWLVGVGPGAGIGFIFVIVGVLGAVAGLGAYLFPAVRDAEFLLSDHDA